MEFNLAWTHHKKLHNNLRDIALLSLWMTSFEIPCYFHVHIPRLHQHILLQLFHILSSKNIRKIPATASIITIFNFTGTILWFNRFYEQFDKAGLAQVRYVFIWWKQLHLIQFKKNCSPNLTINAIYNGETSFSIFKFRSS